jgi:hypothetical protein
MFNNKIKIIKILSKDLCNNIKYILMKCICFINIILKKNIDKISNSKILFIFIFKIMAIGGVFSLVARIISTFFFKRLKTQNRAQIEAKINAGIEAGINADIEAGINADIEAGIDADINSGINSDINADINSGINVEKKEAIIEKLK